MSTDEVDQSDAGGLSGTEPSDSSTSDSADMPPDEKTVSGPTSNSETRVGEYTWAEFMEEYGYEEEVSTLYPGGTDLRDDQLGLDTGEEDRKTVPSGTDWERVSFDPEAYLGYHPDDLSHLITDVFAPNAKYLQDIFLEYVDPETTPVTKDVYTWEHYKWEYYYDDDGSRPRTSDGSIDRFDEEEALGFDPDALRTKLHAGGAAAMELDDVIEERTVNVREDFDEDEFFSTVDGHTTVVNRYDLEKAVPFEKKRHFREVERYWVNKPYAFVIIFHSEKENEKKYYMVEPYLTEIETELQEFLSGKLRTSIKYADDDVKRRGDEDGRRTVIEEETNRLLKRYDLYEKTSGSKKAGLVETLRSLLDEDEKTDEGEDESTKRLEGIETRPEPVLLKEDSDTLTEYQVEKLLYLLKRNFIGYERIDGIKYDINVEDISCDGYNSPVFVYHSEYEQIITNIFHGEEELDDFVVKLAQRSGKGISKRLPQVDATLPDGSRAQLTLGKEVSDHGTNYTIRQFKDVPFTPIDLINWNTFSLDEMAFLWLCIENHKSLIFAGGTASGKTTSLNAVSLFIPSNAKIVSIEDTREVELPQRNWIASVTRPSFSDGTGGDVNEFDLLEAALRQRPDYIVMGEIRGEEGRTAFQVMSTGHTTYTTFHADSVDEVLKRFTTDPINVSKTMFTALDLVSVQTQTRVQGSKVRRNKSLTEINHYDAEHDEINVQDVYQWQAETDEYLEMGDSNTLQDIKFDRGWTHEKLADEMFERRVILAYLIKNGLNTYAQVAATIQAYINDPETILTLIANGQLEQSLEDLREMESVLIDVDPEKEELVPRPDASSETYNLSMDILERAEESLFDEYRGRVPSGLATALGDIQEAESIEVEGTDADEFDFGTVDEGWNLGEEGTELSFDTDDLGGESPSWLEDDDGFEIGSEGAAEAKATSASETADTVDSDSGADDVAVGEQPAIERGTEAESQGSASAREGGRTTSELDDGLADTPAFDDVQAPKLEGDTTTDPSQEDSAKLESSASASDTDSESDDGIAGLFEDMGETLEALERQKFTQVGPTKRSDDSEPESEIDTSDFDAMFPDRDLESIFGDSPEETPSTLEETESSFGGEGEETESSFGGEGEETESPFDGESDEGTSLGSEGEENTSLDGESEDGADDLDVDLEGADSHEPNEDHSIELNLEEPDVSDLGQDETAADRADSEESDSTDHERNETADGDRQGSIFTGEHSDAEDDDFIFGERDESPFGLDTDPTETFDDDNADGGSIFGDDEDSDEEPNENRSIFDEEPDSLSESGGGTEGDSKESEDDEG